MPETPLVFDHLVVGAASLDQGVAHLQRLLGVELPFGGTHPLMGTHNCLTRLAEDAFLEIIAVDPKGRAPARPRWFGLDDPARQARLRERPGLIAWVAGTRDLAPTLARFPELGRAVEMTRGDLVWKIGLTDDGALPENGVLPVLIEWPPGPHPACRMVDRGLRLERLRLFHPEPARIRAVLAALGAGHLASIEATDGPPRIAADLKRPAGGVVTLG